MMKFCDVDEVFEYAKERARNLTAQKLTMRLSNTGSAAIIYQTTYKNILSSIAEQIKNGDIVIETNTLKRAK